MKRKWTALALAVAILLGSLSLPLNLEAAWTCFGPVGNRFCFGFSTDSPPVPYFAFGFGGGPITTEQRYYFWMGQNAVIRGLLLSSHHGTVESGLGDQDIRQGNVALDDSKGVYCITIGGCLNDLGP